MFRKLCGTDSIANIVFVTTKWDIVARNDAERRERDLIAEHLQVELANGARTARHDNTIQSAINALSMVLGHHGIALKLQEQLVDQGLSLQETDAGAAVGADLEAMQKRHTEEIEELKKEMQNESVQSDEVAKKALADKMAQMEEELKKVQADKAMLEMDHARDILEYQRKLNEVASMTGQSSKAVLTEGVSTQRRGGLSVSPVVTFIFSVLELLGDVAK
jgi:hypothetical protein